MSSLWLVGIAAAAKPSTAELEAGLRAAFAGIQGCHHVRLEVEQELPLPLFSLDRERYEVVGVLDGGQWRWGLGSGP